MEVSGLRMSIPSFCAGMDAGGTFSVNNESGCSVRGYSRQEKYLRRGGTVHVQLLPLLLTHLHHETAAKNRDTFNPPPASPRATHTGGRGGS